MRDEQVDADRLATDTVGGEPLGDYVRPTEAYSGEHDDAGIILAAGPGIAAGTMASEASIQDVAPTILGLVGLPAAMDMPGRVLFSEELPRVDTHDHLAPDATTVVAGDEDVNLEQLRELGYIE